MTTQALNLPLDITWQRFGYSRDMIDTNFGELNVPPKWRSSMAVYSYVVPQEQTAESYPNARIVYLRLTCSITGWNPSEELRDSVNLDNVGDQLDDVQRSIWEAIQADGWASTYWACLGAIAQIAIYPSQDDGEVKPDDFPYILDFEPKKRELFESVTEGGEILSASADKLSVQKGTTTVDSTESSSSFSEGFAVGPLGADVSFADKRSKTTTQVDISTTDTSRERRETSSFGTNFSQMYQLFNGYHLGTNRALFVIAPRPHIASDGGFNLLDGERKLEGIQDMFLVVYVPANLKGICLQVNLDTGHDVDPNISDPVRAYMRYPDRPPRQPNGEDEPRPRPGGGGGGGSGGDGIPEPKMLVVTRRVIQNCGRFDVNGNLISIGAPAENLGGRFPLPVFEASLPELVAAPVFARTLRPDDDGRQARTELVNQLNLFQRKIINTMISGFSAGQYKPRPLVQTQTVRRLINLTMRNVRLDLSKLATHRHISRADIQIVKRAGAKTVADLFGREIETARAIDRKRLNAIRNKVVEATLAATNKSEN